MGRLKLSANNDLSPVRQASSIDAGNTDLQDYVDAQEAALQSATLSTLQQASRGAEALQADIEGDTAMSLTPEESAKLNSTLEYCSTTAEVGERLIQSFAGGGVENPDLAVLKAQLETFASNANNIDNGVLATAYGGTGRSDGYANDVYISGSGNNVVTAKEQGFFGDSKQLSSDTDLNTLKTPGIYNVTSPATEADAAMYHYPIANTSLVVQVIKLNASYKQILIAMTGGQILKRYCASNGSWGAWCYYTSGAIGSTFIYISKDGNDLNSGLTSSSPVLTVNQALRVAQGAKGTGTIHFCFGAGEWGNIAVYKDTLQYANIQLLIIVTQAIILHYQMSILLLQVLHYMMVDLVSEIFMLKMNYL